MDFERVLSEDTMETKKLLSMFLLDLRYVPSMQSSFQSSE